MVGFGRSSYGLGLGSRVLGGFGGLVVGLGLKLYGAGLRCRMALGVLKAQFKQTTD